MATTESDQGRSASFGLKVSHAIALSKKIFFTEGKLILLFHQLSAVTSWSLSGDGQ